MFNIVLVEPEIPANTGNIGRTCVLTGARLHLVGPMGFELSDQAVQRAGLAYWQSLDLRTYPSWEIFVARHPAVQDALQADMNGTTTSSRTVAGDTDSNLVLTSDANDSGAPIPVPSGTDATGVAARPAVHFLTKGGERIYCDAHYADGDWLIFGKESAGLDAQLLAEHPHLCERIPMRTDSALSNAHAWRTSFDQNHPELQRDICGNFVDRRAGQITSLNLSNAVAIVLFEALRQTGFVGM